MRLTHLIALCLLFFAVVSCKEKKKALNGTEPVELADFIEFFPDIKLPFQIADSALVTKSPDTARLSLKVFKQFVPDSVLSGAFGKGAKPILYPIGKSVIKDGETYLFVKAVLLPKRMVLILAFEKEKFVTAMSGLSLWGGLNQKEHSLLNMDSRYTITTLKQLAGTDGQTAYNKKVYVYNNAGVFTLILTESNNQRVSEAVLINPIDTLASRHKLAGDYMQDKKNLVSFRDGRKTGTLLFFAHFEKDGGNCKGELKGDAQFTAPNSARFTDNTGSCSIEFKFSGNSVQMKELEGCGSYRDIKCFFEGTYFRKKKPVSRSSAKKK